MTSEKIMKNLHQLTDVLDFIGYDEELLSNETLVSIISFISLVPGRTDIGVARLIGTDAKIVGWHARKLIENRLIEYDKEFSAYYEYGAFNDREKYILKLASKGSSFYVFKKLIIDGFIDLRNIENYTKATIGKQLKKLNELGLIDEESKNIYVISDEGRKLLEDIKNKQDTFNITLMIRLRLEKIDFKANIKGNEIIISPSVGYPFILSIDPSRTLIKYGEP